MTPVDLNTVEVLICTSLHWIPPNNKSQEEKEIGTTAQFLKSEWCLTSVNSTVPARFCL